MKTRDELGIFWPSAEGHVDVAGVFIYGYWKQKPLPSDISPLAAEFASSDYAVDARPLLAENGNYVVLAIWVKKWPSDEHWLNSLAITMQNMFATGAVVAWCGDEYCSWSLSELDPLQSRGFVYAASTAKTGIICRSNLSEDTSYLTKDDLRLVQSVLQGS